MAVEIFFIISGFYMSLILNEKYKVNSLNLAFYKNRFLKIFPIYWTILLMTIIVYLGSFLFLSKNTYIALLVDNFHQLSWSFYYILLSNIFLFGQDLLLFLGINETNIVFTKFFSDTQLPMHQFIVIPQAWTLALELLFYLIAPFFLRKNTILIFTLFIASVFIKISLWFIGYSDDPWSYRFFPSELSFFLAGALSYRIFKANIYKNIVNNKILFYICIFLFIISGLYYFNLRDYMLIGGIEVLKYFIYGFFVLFLPILFWQTKDSKFDRYIGELSYPVYISYIFVMLFVAKIMQNYSVEHIGLLTVVFSILFSVFLNKYIQNYFIKEELKIMKRQ